MRIPNDTGTKDETVSTVGTCAYWYIDTCQLREVEEIDIILNILCLKRQIVINVGWLHLAKN